MGEENAVETRVLHESNARKLQSEANDARRRESRPLLGEIIQFMSGTEQGEFDLRE
jgi:hypothetical protein